MRLANDALAKVLHTATPAQTAPALFLAGSKDALSDADKADLLERLRAGEVIVLEVEAVTYIQREEPNRNAIRFPHKLNALRAIAKTGVGSPFLINHKQGDVLARGGTVLTSKAEKVDGEFLFRQRLKVVKDWAVEGLLDGTIDRFSIGWYPTGPITYSHNGEEIRGWPEYWPGEELEDGTIVEWVYTSADLIEVSGVNVPAVKGTHIEGIKSALAAFAPELPEKQEQKESKAMNSTILTLLGLAATASDERVAEAIGELQSDKKKLETELAATKEQLSAAQAVADKAKEAEEERAKAKLEADITDLYKAGKLTHRHSEKGAESDPLEQHLRELHAVGGRELFDGFVETLAVKVPPRESQSDRQVQDKGALNYGNDRIERLRRGGKLTPERHAELAAKYGNSNRIHISGRS